MPETLIANQVETSSRHEELKRTRRQFVEDLVTHQLISESLAESGELEKFGIDELTGTDSLIHMLVGNGLDGGSAGGFHHAPTAAALGLRREVASTIHNFDPGEQKKTWTEQYEQYREKQKVGETGVYRAMHIRIIETDPVTNEDTIYIKKKGSHMFPDSWTTEQVIQAALYTAQHGTPRLLDGRNCFFHSSEVNEVTVQAWTDLTTGKIVSAYPGRR